MTKTDLENRIRRMEWPATSPALRARVSALAPAAPRATWSDRVWFSHTFRWSVAAAATVLILVNVWSGPARAGAVTTEVEPVRVLAIEAGFSEDAAASLARRAMVPRSPMAASSRAAGLQEIIGRDGGH